MDPDNTIVKLCVEGMDQEAQGDCQAALRLFLSAWEQAADDFERCIAAHYVARHQSPQEALVWNQRSLDLARTIDEEKVRTFLPSLYLNMGKAHEDLGSFDDARRYYAMTGEILDSLPDDPYGRTLRAAAQRALRRTLDAEVPS